jgi:hypothetical protein
MLSNFAAPRVAFLRDTTEQICFEKEVRRVSELHPDVELYGYYELTPGAPGYDEDVRAILQDLKAQGVESVVGCSYLDLCIQVSSVGGEEVHRALHMLGSVH